MCFEHAAISSFGTPTPNLDREKLSQVCPNELPATCFSFSLSKFAVAGRSRGTLGRPRLNQVGEAYKSLREHQAVRSTKSNRFHIFEIKKRACF